MTSSEHTNKVTLHVCVTCRRGEEPLEPRDARSGARFFERLKSCAASEPGGGVQVELRPVECLSGCKRGCTVAVAGQGKWTFVIADLDPGQHTADILTFAGQHAAHPEGLPVWRERPEIVKRSVLARVPPLTPAQREEERAAQ
jgi:predicted metal-binding protein